MESVINIIDLCGKNIVTREDGKKVHDLITAQWYKAEKIKIDFGNVLVASVSFFDEIFGRLAFEYSQNELTSKIQVVNIQDFDRALLNDIFRSRLQQKNMDDSQKVTS